jgi:CBS domain containing-hemolysin-like protein
MLAFILAVALAGIMLLAISLNKTYQHITRKEIKRQARQGDKLARALYKPVSYGPSLQVLLWLIVILAAAGSCVLFTTTAPSWLAFILIVVILTMGFWWLPASEVTSFGGRLAVWCAPAISKALSYLHPLLTRVGNVVRQHYPLNVHTGIYEKEDLLELLESQKSQPDNRIPAGEIDVAENALSFGDIKVQEIMVPRRAVRVVSTEDAVGPIFIDELHKTGFSRFPVYEGKRDNIVGMLYLRDVAHLQHAGTVAKAMRSEVFYVHEEFSLYQVLQAFLRSKHHLFIVVNGFEEYIGIITIEDVLAQILGTPILNEFDSYDDRRAVAKLLAEAEHEQHKEAESEPGDDQPPEDVVE